MELDDEAGLILAGISALCFRPAKVFELRQRPLIRAELFQPFQFRANFRVTRSPSACVGETTRADLLSLTDCM